MNKWDVKEGSEQRRDGLDSGVQFPWPWWEGQSKKWRWELGDRGGTTALVQMSEDGDWTRAEAQEVEKSRWLWIRPHLPYSPAPNRGLTASAQTPQSVRKYLLNTFFILGRALDYGI